MSKIIKLGAPSLSGRNANELVAEAFADATYPLTVTVKNHMPRDVVFPEIPDLFLEPVHGLYGVALGCNRDECVVRALAWADAHARARAAQSRDRTAGRLCAVQLPPNPQGKPLLGRSAALRRLPIARYWLHTAPCSPSRAGACAAPYRP